MSETAAFLVDRVIPRVPVRQWVLSLPRPIRYILARDATLLGQALRIFVAEIFRDLRRRAGIRGAKNGPCGAVTGVQRFGGALNLNIHFHSLVLDGVYVTDPATGDVRFRRLPPPSRDDLDRVLSWARHRILKMLSRKGFAVGLEGEKRSAGEESFEEPSALEEFQGASIRELIGLSGGSRRVSVIGRESDEPVKLEEKPFCMQSGDGFNLEAGVRIRAADREGLEKLCRYVLRPPFSGERLRRLEDGRVLYEFRRPRPDGSTHLVLEPEEFLEKLAALVPPPRSHLVRYHGVLAPHAKRRQKVVPPERPKGSRPGRCVVDLSASGSRRDSSKKRWRERMRWADLLRRTLGEDALECPRCQGRMEPIAEITEPEVIGKILRAMGLSDHPPCPEPARPPPQMGFDFDQDHMERPAPSRKIAG